MGKRGPRHTDLVVGRNIRIRRIDKGMSQGELGKRLGLTYQQVQKYEKGVNSVGASRLMQIAEALDAPIHAFFAGDRPLKREVDSPLELISDRHALRLARAFARIRANAVRHSLLKLVEDIADSRSNPDRRKDKR